MSLLRPIAQFAFTSQGLYPRVSHVLLAKQPAVWLPTNPALHWPHLNDPYEKREVSLIVVRLCFTSYGCSVWFANSGVNLFKVQTLRVYSPLYLYRLSWAHMHLSAQHTHQYQHIPEKNKQYSHGKSLFTTKTLNSKANRIHNVCWIK